MPKFLMIQLINFAGDVYKSQSVWIKWMHETVEAWLFLKISNHCLLSNSDRAIVFFCKQIHKNKQYSKYFVLYLHT